MVDSEGRKDTRWLNLYPQSLGREFFPAGILRGGLSRKLELCVAYQGSRREPCKLALPRLIPNNISETLYEKQNSIKRYGHQPDHHFKYSGANHLPTSTCCACSAGADQTSTQSHSAHWT